MNSTEPLFQGAPLWLTLPFAAIAIGVVFALLVLWWGARLAGRRRNAREEIEEYNEEYREEAAQARPITPPVAPPPPPLAEPPVAPAPEPAAEIVPSPPPPVVEEAPAPQLAEPVAEVAASPAEETPTPEPLADEPIAAAAPLDATPASLASDIAEPAHAPAPAPSEPAAPEPEPAPAAPAADDLTRMKGVGPRLAERLGSVGITSFAQLAALTPEEADALDARLGDFQGRIHRDRWIEQASFLANEDIAGFEGVFGKL